MLNLVHARTFLAVLSERGFRAAARDLNLSPSTVVEHIRQLEADLAAPLLVRRRGVVELTSQGEDLILSIADDGVGDSAKADPRSTGMGQRIVAAVASKLDACVERDPDHAGTKILLKFRRVPAPPSKANNAAAS